MQLKPYPNVRFRAYLQQQQERFQTILAEACVATRRFSSGEILLRQGQEVSHLYLVSAGRVSMSITGANGRRFQLGEMQCDGHIFGEMEFFTHSPCQWNVVSEEELDAEVICVRRLEQAIEQAPDLALFFACALAEDYQDSMDIYTHRLLHPITYNIAYDLLQRNENEVVLGGFNRAEPEAERFGTSGRVYRRAVRDLIERGLIAKNDNQLTIVDPAGLRAFLDEQ